MELFEEMRKYGIPDVRITQEEWIRYYGNTYNILAVTRDVYDETFVFAAEDIIKIYLLLDAKKNEEEKKVS